MLFTTLRPPSSRLWSLIGWYFLTRKVFLSQLFKPLSSSSHWTVQSIEQFKPLSSSSHWTVQVIEQLKSLSSSSHCLEGFNQNKCYWKSGWMCNVKPRLVFLKHLRPLLLLYNSYHHSIAATTTTTTTTATIPLLLYHAIPPPSPPLIPFFCIY